MTSYGFEHKYPETEHHWTVLIVAVLLSLLVHSGMVFYFRDYSFSSPNGIQQRLTDLHNEGKVPPMTVDRLNEDPLLALQNLPGERVVPPRGATEIIRRVDELSPNSPPALTAPPPIPREALTPGVPKLSEATAKAVDTTPWMPRQEIAEIFNRTVQDSEAMLPRREIPLVERVVHAPDVVPSIDLAGRQFGNSPVPPAPVQIKTEEKIAELPLKDKLPSAAPKLDAPDVPPAVTANATEQKFAGDTQEKRGSVKGALTDAEKEKIRQEIEKQTNLASKQTGAQPNAGSTAGGGTGTDGGTAPAETMVEKTAKKVQEEISSIQENATYEPIDDLLSVNMETFRDSDKAGKVYFRIGIQPRTDRPVQIIPKDLIFLVDVSGSMNLRLSQCCKAMITALAGLNTGDRFNIVAFRDTFEKCFDQWADASAENLQKATRFINNMQAQGNTDLYGSLQTLFNFVRDPNRPMIAYVVTDGMPTSGEIESTPIIGKFSKLNNGMMSVYMFGASPRANRYLIDMLTYCNRGGSAILEGERWGIPKAMAASYQGIRNPVMSDVTVVFDTGSKAEVYPRSTTNLYKDQQLEIYGECPADAKEVICQVRGLAAKKGYDSIIRLNLSKDAKSGKNAIKERWANQKMYHLVGEYSRQPRHDTMQEMIRLNKEYGVKIPYQTQLKR